MNTTTNALDIARAYVAAIASKDVEKIISISASNIACTSPLGQITGLERFRGFHDGFAKMIKKLTVLAVYGDDKQAVVVYDVETHPVARAVTVELIKVEDGKLASTEVIYDATPFAAYMARAQRH